MSYTKDLKSFAYLDIETTGLSPHYGDLTVIGLHFENGGEQRTIQLVGDEISPSRLIEMMEGVNVLYTYNGTRFDPPFIREKLGVDLTEHCMHKDLMYECWRKDLYGGLKAVEIKLGIKRGLTDINGRIAVELWYRYKLYRDERSLEILLEYNREDVSNLKIIRQKLNV